MMKYTEAIGLALVIAGVLGAWAHSALERPEAPDMACELQLNSGGSEVSFRNLHCSHVAQMRTLHQPALAGHVQAGDSQAASSGLRAGAELAAAMGQACDDAN
jgi:hypothetical protein